MHLFAFFFSRGKPSVIKSTIRFKHWLIHRSEYDTRGVHTVNHDPIYTGWFWFLAMEAIYNKIQDGKSIYLSIFFFKNIHFIMSSTYPWASFIISWMCNKYILNALTWTNRTQHSPSWEYQRDERGERGTEEEGSSRKKGVRTCAGCEVTTSLHYPRFPRQVS